MGITENRITTKNKTFRLPIDVHKSYDEIFNQLRQNKQITHGKVFTMFLELYYDVSKIYLKTTASLIFDLEAKKELIAILEKDRIESGKQKNKYYKELARNILGQHASAEEVNTYARGLQNENTKLTIGNLLQIDEKIKIMDKFKEYANAIQGILERKSLLSMNEAFESLKSNELYTNGLTEALNKIAKKIKEADYGEKDRIRKEISKFADNL